MFILYRDWIIIGVNIQNINNDSNPNISMTSILEMMGEIQRSKDDEIFTSKKNMTYVDEDDGKEKEIPLRMNCFKNGKETNSRVFRVSESTN